MRFPHTIPLNTKEVYQPSEQTASLLGEVNRTLRSEDVTWDRTVPPTLITLCVESLVANFEEKQVLAELSDEDRCLLLETLPTNLPLTLTVPLLEDGIYWKRSSQERWKSMNDVRDYGGSWKRLYMERHLQEHIETLAPEGYQHMEEDSMVQLCSPYVKRLNIRQLQVSKQVQAPEWEEPEGAMEAASTDHINLELFIRGLQNLEEMHIMFGVRDCGMDFEWSLFEFSKPDCTNIGLGLAAAKCLKIFRIHRSSLDDSRVTILLQHMMKNTTITTLDFSHCRIGDIGALAIGKLLTVHPSLKKLILCNNKIGAKGANGLAFALTKKDLALELLNLRLNVIGDEGVIHLCSALASSKHPRKLILAGCGFTETAAIRLGQMLQQNSTLEALDVSNNNLGEVGGEAFDLGLQTNNTLLRLDYRMTGITQQYEFLINKALKRNVDLYKKKQRELAEALANKDEDWEENLARREKMMAPKKLRESM